MDTSSSIAVPPPYGPGDRGPPPVLVASRWLGKPSEVWMWRQLKLFSRLRPTALTWRHDNRDVYPMEGIPVAVMPTPEEPNDGPARWQWRLGAALGGNFYGTRGPEKALITRILRDCGARVILCQFGHIGLRLLPAAAECGIPVVVHFHGQDISSGLRNKWYRWSLQRHLNAFAAAVCVGSHQRRRLVELGLAPEKAHLIPCGVPTDQFCPAARGPRESITFVSVTRLVPGKGVAVALRALASVRPTLPPARYIVVGDGPELAPLQSLAAELGLGSCVTFTGVQPPETVKTILADADVFVQHSLTDAKGWDEGFGVSIAEASAMELPVLVSDCGGITDQVVHEVTGLVVPEHDEAGTAAAMARLAGDAGLRRRMGRAGRERMVVEFDTRSQVAKLEEVLLSSIDPASTAGSRH